MTYLLLLAFCKAPPLNEHRQQFYKKERDDQNDENTEHLVANI